MKSQTTRRKTRLLGVIGLLAALSIPVHAGAAPGDLDTSFGSGGKVTTAIGAGGYGQDVAIDGSGRIVVAGYSSNGTDDDFAVVRYTASGALDTTFGSGGMAYSLADYRKGEGVPHVQEHLR
jgi:uncharacterized delta-60 repeat protein